MAEGEPPLSQMHPMRAIFMIPNRPPPTLRNPQCFSDLFSDFLATCLKKDPSQRPTAADLLKHPFIKKEVDKLEQSSNTGLPILQELVEQNLDLVSEARSVYIEEEKEFRDSTINGSLSLSDVSTMLRGGTLTKKTERNQIQMENMEPGFGCGTMVFRGNASSLTIEGRFGSSNDLYGTMIDRSEKKNNGSPIDKEIVIVDEFDGEYHDPVGGEEFDMDPSGTMVAFASSTMKSTSCDGEGSEGNGYQGTLSEPSFMKYFRQSNEKKTDVHVVERSIKSATIRPASTATLHVKMLTQQLAELERKYEQEKKELERIYLENKAALEKQLDALHSC
jgi:serine/threonine protein kinase